MSGINRIEKVNGVESIVITMPVNEINCSIVGIFPISHFNGKAKSTIITIILVITASSMLIGIFIYIATSALLGRVRMLAKAMRQVRNGKMDIVLPISSQDEFGELTITFNHMTKHINDLIETVYKIQIMEREAELKALEAQINPHFLYNTLATVAWSGRMANAPEVVDISNSLARFYRLVLSKGKTRISVKEELEMVKEYLYIQKIRFVDLLEVKYDVDKNVLCYSTMKNLLQPIVENALSHGIQPKRYRGTIIVKAKAEGNQIVYAVIDDGVGMNPETLKGVMEGRVERSHGSGYAIKNVMDRLRTFYGDDSSVDIFSRPGIGTTVTIRIMRSEPLCVDL
jgi:two-component system sensor histidine kinase YesM